MRSFRVRTLMIAVGVVALILGSLGPGRRWYRRWSYHRAQAALYARFESTELLDHARERRISADREAIRRTLIHTGFAGMSDQEIERAIDRTVELHRRQAGQSLAAAKSWAEKRRDCDTAAFWAFDPWAPEVP